MNKQEFIEQLRKELSGLPQKETEEVISFYSEMIDDGIEDGLSEEEAVASVGDLSEIAQKEVADIPLSKIAKERIRKRRRLSALEIILLVLGSPIWLALGISALAVIFSVYVSLWTIVICLWAGFVSLVACFIGGVIAFIVFTALGKGASGVAMLAAALICAGLAIFAFLGCKAATKGVAILTKKMAITIKNWFIKKEKV
jgi:uncharacterized membrane protein